MSVVSGRALRNWWRSLDDGAWVVPARRVPGEWIIWVGFALACAAGAFGGGFNDWTASALLMGAAFAVSVAGSFVVYRNRMRTRESPRSQRRLFKFEVVWALAFASVLVAGCVGLLIFVIVSKI